MSSDLTVCSSAGTEALDRRAAVGRLLAGAAAATTAAGLLGAATAPAGAQQAAPAAPTAQPTATSWDMSWTTKLARYRTAYDSPEILHGAALAFAAAAVAGYQQALGAGPDQVTPVLILRHTASVMTLDDAMWDRLELGAAHDLKDPTTGEPARRNPFLRWQQGDQHSMVGAPAGLDVLMAAGAVVLTCNNALRGVAYQLRRKEPTLTPEAATAAVRAAVLPGVYVMPNGIFAVSAAQDAGCHYMRVLV